MGKNGDFGSHFGEMERNRLAATCEHNYGAAHSRLISDRDHVIPH